MAWAAVAGVAATVVGGVVAGSMSKSGNEASQESNTYNAKLDAYTRGYVEAAPWGFASLDPTATLAEGSAEQKYGADFTANLKKMSDAEKQDAEDTRQAMSRIRDRQSSGQFLTPQETEFINTSLDKAFEYAHKTGYADWEKGAQSLAGRKGLRTSDTPVAKPAMEELRNFELGLGSNRASMGLSTTLDLSAQNQAFDKSFAEFQKTLQLNRTNSRQGFLFGGGMGGIAGISGSGSMGAAQQSSPNMFESIGQSMDLGSRIGSQLMTAGSNAYRAWGPSSSTPTPTPLTGGIGDMNAGAAGWGV